MSNTKWYITETGQNGLYLNNPEQCENEPENYFTPYQSPPVWSSFISSTEDIFIDSRSLNQVGNTKFTFMSKNPNKLEQLIHLWNSWSEETEDYFDWD